MKNYFQVLKHSLLLSRTVTVTGATQLSFVLFCASLATYSRAQDDTRTLTQQTAGVITAGAFLLSSLHSGLLSFWCLTLLPLDRDLPSLTEAAYKRARTLCNRLGFYDLCGELFIFHFAGWAQFISEVPTGTWPSLTWALISCLAYNLLRFVFPLYPVQIYVASRLVVGGVSVVQGFLGAWFQTQSLWYAVSTLPLQIVYCTVCTLLSCLVFVALQRKVAIVSYRLLDIPVPDSLGRPTDAVIRLLLRLSPGPALSLAARFRGLTMTHIKMIQAAVEWTGCLMLYMRVPFPDMMLFGNLCAAYSFLMVVILGTDTREALRQQEESRRSGALAEFEGACSKSSAKSPRDLASELSDTASALFPNSLFTAVVLFDFGKEGPAAQVKFQYISRAPQLSSGPDAEERAQELRAALLPLLADPNSACWEAASGRSIMDSALGLRRPSEFEDEAIYPDMNFMLVDQGASRVLFAPLIIPAEDEALGALMIPFLSDTTVAHNDLSSAALALALAVHRMNASKHGEAEEQILRDLVPAHLVPIILEAQRTLSGEAMRLERLEDKDKSMAVDRARGPGQDKISSVQDSGKSKSLQAARARRSSMRTAIQWRAPEETGKEGLGSAPARPPRVYVHAAVENRATFEEHEEVSVLQADCVGYTQLASDRDPLELMVLLHEFYSAVDAKAEELGLWKLDIVGDAYIAVAGMVSPDPNHAVSILRLACSFHECAAQVSARAAVSHNLTRPLRFRVGIASGPASSAVIGKIRKKFIARGHAVHLAAALETRCSLCGDRPSNDPLGVLSGDPDATLAAPILVSARTFELLGLKANAPGVLERLVRIEGRLTRAFTIDAVRLQEAAAFSGLGRHVFKGVDLHVARASAGHGLNTEQPDTGDRETLRSFVVRERLLSDLPPSAALAYPRRSSGEEAPGEKLRRSKSINLASLRQKPARRTIGLGHVSSMLTAVQDRLLFFANRGKGDS